MVGGKRLSDEGQEQENDCERKRQKANVMNDADSSTESSESEPKTGFRDHLKTENMELTFASQKWSILVSILLSDKYRIAQDTSWKEMKRKVEETFPLLTSDGAADSQLIQELIESDKVLKVIKTEQGDVIEFVSDDIRHEVMAYFTSNCLRSDEDYKNYIDLTSVDSLLEYARSQLYIKDDGEQCLYLTEEMILFFIQKHGLDALKNIGPISENIKCSKELSYILKVPEEVLEWDVAARSSYVDCALKGTRTIHRARAMLVGCAGAGKTTLLNRLQKKSFKEIKEIQSTVGLEVHEDIFERDSKKQCSKSVFISDINDATDTDGKLLLSIVDFGGQCAYYACHQ
ncbi:uncharacterized protein LOC134262283, partial [Saccostrea cucullata]|uniref:uncharacterized protein LOC134262283 n=1 Tax=Saccostrea cuccullata TaxID=36930 RepID=UPI002ECFF985